MLEVYSYKTFMHRGESNRRGAVIYEAKKRHPERRRQISQAENYYNDVDDRQEANNIRYITVLGTCEKLSYILTLYYVDRVVRNSFKAEKS